MKIFYRLSSPKIQIVRNSLLHDFSLTSKLISNTKAIRRERERETCLHKLLFHLQFQLLLLLFIICDMGDFGNFMLFYLYKRFSILVIEICYSSEFYDIVSKFQTRALCSNIWLVDNVWKMGWRIVFISFYLINFIYNYFVFVQLIIFVF